MRRAAAIASGYNRLVRDLLGASQVDSQGVHLDLVTVRLPELASVKSLSVCNTDAP